MLKYRLLFKNLTYFTGEELQYYMQPDSKFSRCTLNTQVLPAVLQFAWLYHLYPKNSVPMKSSTTKIKLFTCQEYQPLFAYKRYANLVRRAIDFFFEYLKKDTTKQYQYSPVPVLKMNMQPWDEVAVMTLKEGFNFSCGEIFQFACYKLFKKNDG